MATKTTLHKLLDELLAIGAVTIRRHPQEESGEVNAEGDRAHDDDFYSVRLESPTGTHAGAEVDLMDALRMARTQERLARSPAPARHTASMPPPDPSDLIP